MLVALVHGIMHPRSVKKKKKRLDCQYRYYLLVLKAVVISNGISGLKGTSQGRIMGVDIADF